MRVQAFDFSQFHAKVPPAGSTIIRIRQLMKYWPELTSYRYGDNPDVLIFQKVYVNRDYRFPVNFGGIKILDICDPDWLDGMPIKETVDAMHAVVCPTESLASFLRQLTDKPVVVIPDRWDVSLFPKKKEHVGNAKTVLWYGYRHNAETLRPAMQLINHLGLNILVIADDDPMVWQWVPRNDADDFRHNRYTYIKHPQDPSDLHKEMQKADFCILPSGARPIDVFKSDNKSTRAILCGLPVARTGEDMNLFMKGEERNKYMDSNYARVSKEYDVRKSVSQYKDLIASLSNT